MIRHFSFMAPFFRAGHMGQPLTWEVPASSREKRKTHRTSSSPRSLTTCSLKQTQVTAQFNLIFQL